MSGIMNTIRFIYEQWSNITIIFSLILLGVKYIMKFKALSKEKWKEAVLIIVKEELLKMMSDAERDWTDYKKSGKIKKSQVINTIYEQFPILKEYIDQESLIKRISDMIDESIENMDEIIKNLGKDEEDNLLEENE